MLRRTLPQKGSMFEGRGVSWITFYTYTKNNKYRVNISHKRFRYFIVILAPRLSYFRANSSKFGSWQIVNNDKCIYWLGTTLAQSLARINPYFKHWKSVKKLVYCAPLKIVLVFVSVILFASSGLLLVFRFPVNDIIVLLRSERSERSLS